MSEPVWRDLFPPFVRPYYRAPLFVERAEGVWITERGGRRHLDAYAGVATLALGHRPAEVDAAVRDQTTRFGHLSWIYLNEGAVDYARRLLAAAGAPLSRAFFVTSGSEAVDLALLLARRAAGGGPVIAQSHGYHGGTWLTAHATGLPAWRPGGAAPDDLRFVPSPDCLDCADRGGCRDGAVPCLRPLADALEACGHRAVLLIEPVLGVGGVIVPPEPYWREFARLRDRHAALLVCDEVQSGFGRLGRTLFGYQRFGVAPDLVALGKGIAAGMPLGGLLMTEAVSAAAGDLLHFSTFGGHPLSIAAAAATLAALDAPLLARVEAEGERALNGLRALCAGRPAVREVRGVGYFIGVACRDAEAAAERLEAARDAGLLIGIGGMRREILRIEPALVFAREHWDELLAILGKIL